MIRKISEMSLARKSLRRSKEINFINLLDFLSSHKLYDTTPDGDVKDIDGVGIYYFLEETGQLNSILVTINRFNVIFRKIMSLKNVKINSLNEYRRIIVNSIDVKKISNLIKSIESELDNVISIVNDLYESYHSLVDTTDRTDVNGFRFRSKSIVFNTISDKLTGLSRYINFYSDIVHNKELFIASGCLASVTVSYFKDRANDDEDNFRNASDEVFEESKSFFTSYEKTDIDYYYVLGTRIYNYEMIGIVDNSNLSFTINTRSSYGQSDLINLTFNVCYNHKYYKY